MLEDAEIATAVGAALGSEPENVERLPGGANNVVVRARVEGADLLAKLYFTHPEDSRDRLGTEFEVLSFLWRNGIRSIPQPLSMDSRRGIGIYEFVPGERLREASWEDGLELADLLGRMWNLRNQPEAALLPQASDAFFRLRDYLDSIEKRLERLGAAVSAGRDRATAEYVARELEPGSARVLGWIESRALELGVDPAREVPARDRTLTPGDFGFHNVLRRRNGQLVFLDFEYAGWEDPAHVLANACLPPEVPLPRMHHSPLMRELARRLHADRQAVARARLVYPLLALKWSLIVLNEHLAVPGQRRAFAGGAGKIESGAQVEKSRGMLEIALDAAGSSAALDAILVAPPLPVHERT